ncbi:MAG: YggT family protein [Dehalococcoidales bacterium]|jgi:YggT family protein|nr:hypothetical protein [Dehalococcoidales bacterium]MDP6127276.1 YggT family protein [Dehalococcoidales bacterium]MDP7524959.1 YggT family protein [Dehalococcoidales bacterium]|tara:strand:- start:158 stop:409 length:252 start_codon:yes stop_codon:yes gene_type:complete
MNLDFFRFLAFLCEVLTMAVFIRSIFSWVSPGQTNMLTIFLFRVTEPFLAPLRRIIPRIGMFDLSPLAAIIILQILSFFFSRL